VSTQSEDDQTTAHLVRCYGNVQDVLRFLDTKAGVVFALSGVILGTLVSKRSDWCPWAQFFLGISVVSTVLSMLCALRAVWPSHGPKDPEHLTLLFPALHPKSKMSSGNSPDIPTIVRHKLKAPLTGKFIRDEYGNQLAHLNRALVRKISSLRSAIVCIFVALVSIGICQFGKMDEKEKVTSVKLEASKTSIPITLVDKVAAAAQDNNSNPHGK
jgi:hypothetical protein